MGVVLRSVVLVAQAECQGEIAPWFPFILEEESGVLGADVAWSCRELNELIGQSHYEVGAIIPAEGATGSVHILEVELAVHIKVEHLVVLVWCEGEAAFKRMPACEPGHAIVPGECIVDKPRRTLIAEPGGHATGER